ncbi:sensor histidine kinase, partial [Enterococcus cecorum]|nr:sensor histidine kinase [Enterococcus cecorum]
MNRLMQIYAVLLVGVIFLTVVGLCLYTADTNYRKMVTNMEDLEKRIQNSVEANNDALNFIYMELAGSNTAIDNIRA